MSAFPPPEDPRETADGFTFGGTFIKRKKEEVARRMRLSVDILVPDNDDTSERQWNQAIKEMEEQLRVVILGDAEIQFVKKAESHFTVHNHHSTPRISCRGCVTLSDDLQGNIEGL